MSVDYSSVLALKKGSHGKVLSLLPFGKWLLIFGINKMSLIMVLVKPIISIK